MGWRETMNVETDVVVIGLGAMGSAALDHVARRGAKVWGLEQFSPGHAWGSSWGESRIIRQAYFEHPDYVPLVRRSWALWAELERGQREPLLLPSGGVVMGAERSAMMQGVARSVKQWDIVHEWWDAKQLHRRFPAMGPEPDTIALYEPGGAIIRPEAGIAAMLRRASEAGAHAAYHEVVTGLQSDGRALTVITQKHRYTAQRVIVTAGPWLSGVMPSLASALWCERQPVFWMRPPDIAPFALGAMPWYVWETSAGPQIYGFPSVDGVRVKAGIHHTGIAGVPAPGEDVPLGGELGSLQELLASRFPQMGSEISARHLCWYTNSSDGHFLVGPWSQDPRVVIAGGFSGHGYKFAPVIGEILADYALLGGTGLPCAFLRPERVEAL